MKNPRLEEGNHSELRRITSVATLFRILDMLFAAQMTFVDTFGGEATLTCLTEETVLGIDRAERLLPGKEATTGPFLLKCLFELHLQRKCIVCQILRVMIERIKRSRLAQELGQVAAQVY